MRAQGVCRRDIAGCSTIRGHLYLGRLIFNRRPSKSAPHIRENPRSQWIIVDNAHPSIVSQELFDEANRTRTRRGKHNVRQWNRHTYLLTGLVLCAKCGGAVISWRGDNRHNKNKPYFHYACSNARKRHTCDVPLVRCDDLDRAVLEAVRSQPLDAAVTICSGHWRMVNLRR